MAFELNHLADEGKHLDPAETRTRLEDGTFFKWIESEFGDELELSPYHNERETVMAFRAGRTRHRYAHLSDKSRCARHEIRTPVPEGLGGLAALAVHDRSFERAARLLGAARAIGPIADPVLEARLERGFFAPAEAALGTSQ